MSRSSAKWLRSSGALDMDTFIRLLERMGEHDGWDLLPLIDVPTLIIVGSRDVFTPRSAAERMARRTRGSEIMVLPGRHITPR